MEFIDIISALAVTLILAAAMLLYKEKVNPKYFASNGMIICAEVAICAFLMSILDGSISSLPDITNDTLINLIASAVFFAGICLLVNQAFKTASATKVCAILFAYPIFVLLFSGETVSIWKTICMVVVVVSVICLCVLKDKTKGTTWMWYAIGACLMLTVKYIFDDNILVENIISNSCATWMQMLLSAVILLAVSFLKDDLKTFGKIKPGELGCLLAVGLMMGIAYMIHEWGGRTDVSERIAPVYTFFLPAVLVPDRIIKNQKTSLGIAAAMLFAVIGTLCTMLPI